MPILQIPVLSLSRFGGGGRRDRSFTLIEDQHESQNQDDYCAARKNCNGETIHRVILSTVIIAETFDSLRPREIIAQCSGDVD